MSKKQLLKEYTSGEFRFGFELEGFIKDALGGGGYYEEDYDRERDEAEYEDVFKELAPEIFSEMAYDVPCDELAQVHKDNIYNLTVGSTFMVNSIDHNNLDDLPSVDFYQITKDDFIKQYPNGKVSTWHFVDDHLYNDGSTYEFVDSTLKTLQSGTPMLFTVSHSDYDSYVAESQGKGWYFSYESEIMCSERERNLLDDNECPDSYDFRERLSKTYETELISLYGEEIETELNEIISGDGELYNRVYPRPEINNNDTDPHDIDQIVSIRDELEELFTGNEVFKLKPSLDTDPSLKPDGPSDAPFELNSQVLNFKPSVLSKLSNWLYDIQDEYDFYVNKSCGFHTHISWPNANPVDMLWVLMNLTYDKKTLDYITKIQRDGEWDIKLFGGMAEIGYLTTIRNIINGSYGSKDDRRYESLIAQMQTNKFTALNIHRQSTLEWRGPRDFINPRSINDIVSYIKRLYTLVMKINSYLMNDELEGLSKRKLYELGMQEMAKYVYRGSPNKDGRSWDKTKARDKSDANKREYVKGLLTIPENYDGDDATLYKAYDMVKGVSPSSAKSFATLFLSSHTNNPNITDEAKAKFALQADDIIFAGENLRILSRLSIDYSQNDDLVEKIIKGATTKNNVSYNNVYHRSDPPYEALMSLVMSPKISKDQQSRVIEQVDHAPNWDPSLSIMFLDEVRDNVAVRSINEVEDRTVELKSQLWRIEEFRNIYIDYLEDMEEQDREGYTGPVEDIVSPVLIFDVFIDAIKNNNVEMFNRLRGEVDDIVKLIDKDDEVRELLR